MSAVKPLITDTTVVYLVIDPRREVPVEIETGNQLQGVYACFFDKADAYEFAADVGVVVARDLQVREFDLCDSGPRREIESLIANLIGAGTALLLLAVAAASVLF